jgi:hypothetical protein
MSLFLYFLQLPYNLDGEKSNFTLSDDDDAFQECQSSLTDLSGVKNQEEDEKNDTLEGEVISPNGSNKTLVLDENVTFETKKVEVSGEKTVDSGLDEKSNNTFNEVSDKVAEKETTFEESVTQETSKTVQEPVVLNETVVLEAPENSSSESHQQQASEPMKLNVTTTFTENEVSQEALETPLPDTPVSEVDFEAETEAGDFSAGGEGDASGAIKDFEVNVEEIRAEGDGLRFETAGLNDVTMEDISRDRQDIASAFPKISEISVKNEFEDIEPSYRNIDDLGRLNKTRTLSDTCQEEPTSSMTFKEELKNSFEVEFKMPAAPVFKPSNEPSPPAHLKDEVFGCGSSCKTQNN